MADSGGAQLLKYSPVKKAAEDVAAIAARRAKRRCCKQPCLLTAITIVSMAVVGFVLGVIIMWGTDSFDQAILQALVIKNNTQTYNWWVEPPIQPLFKIRVFNYTNSKEFEEGIDDKLRVQEVGPFTFRQFSNKADIQFSNNGTVFYRDNSSFEYVPELSVQSLEKNLYLVNMPLVSAISLLRGRSSIAQTTASISINYLGSKPFLHLSANDFLWGYKEALTSLAQIFSFIGISPSDLRLGFLQARSGISGSYYEAHTGVEDIEKLGIVESVDGVDHLEAWGDNECGRVQGTAGAIFPPHLVQQKKNLYFFTKDLCRRIPLVFKEDLMINNLPVRRYHPPKNVFSKAEDNPENACFCPGSECPPGGVFNSSPCFYGAPVMVSLPHFYLGEKELQESILGLEPDPLKHDLYWDIHPKLGIAMGGKTRIQFNVMIHKLPRFPQLNRFTEGIILPIAWIEVGVDELPPDMYNLFYHGTYTIDITKKGLRYGLIAGSLILMSLLSLLVYKFKSNQKLNNEMHVKYANNRLS